MAGAFTRGGPTQSALTEMTPEEREAQFYANLKGSAASFADPFGLTTMFGPDSVAGPLKEMQEGGSPGTNLFGAAAFPMGMLTAAPRATGAAAGLGAFFGGAETSEAAGETKRKKKQAAKPVEAEKEATDEIKTLVDKWKDKDPTLLGIYSTYNDAKAASRANVKGVDKASADEVRRRANEDADKALGDLMARIEKLDPPKQTFSQRYGDLAEAWPWIQAGTGIAVGGLLGGKARMGDDMFKYGPWKRSINRFDKAMDPNPGVISKMTGSGNNPSRAFTEAERIKGFVDDFGGKKKGFFDGMAVPTIGGATASAEVGLLPDAYNLRYAPSDTQDYQDAQRKLSSATEAAKGYGPMIGLSALGAGTATKLVGVGGDKTAGLTARSRPAMDRLGTGTRSERAANFRGSIQDDIDLANMGRPTPNAFPAPQPGPTPLGPAPGQAMLPPPAQAAPAQGATPTALPGPVKPPRKPALKQKDLLTDFEKGLKNMEAGKPFAPKGGFMRGASQEAKDRVMKGADNLGLTNPNAGPMDVQRARKLMTSGNLKLGIAGGATGYSALLAQRLAAMQGEQEE